MSHRPDTRAGALFRMCVRDAVEKGLLARKPLTGEADPMVGWLDRMILRGVPLTLLEPEIRAAAKRRATMAGPATVDLARDERICRVFDIAQRVLMSAITFDGQDAGLNLSRHEAIRILAAELGYSARTIKRAFTKLDK